MGELMAVDLPVSDSYRVQASFKFGPRDNHGAGTHMLNVRADDLTELGEILDDVPAKLADKLGNVSAVLGASANISTAMGPTETVEQAEVNPIGDATASPPLCAHGPRSYFKQGTKWEAFFCPQPKEATNKCDPIFRDKADKAGGNFSEPYWPKG